MRKPYTVLTEESAPAHCTCSALQYNRHGAHPPITVRDFQTRDSHWPIRAHNSAADKAAYLRFSRYKNCTIVHIAGLMECYLNFDGRECYTT